MSVYKYIGVMKMNRVFIRQIPMYQHNNAFVLEDENGDYNIYVNQEIAANKLVPTLRHELLHALKGHLHDDIKTLSEIEQEASK